MAVIIPSGYSYGYDQLNRLVKMRQHGLSNGTTTWNSGSISSNYKEDYTYDGNGNILNLQRNGSSGVQMDNLNYSYNRDGSGKLQNNRLASLGDGVAGVAHTGELEGTSSYGYDAIGNLTSDSKEGISAIDWSVYGKIRSITKSGGNIAYSYDPSGNRVRKVSGNTTTWYVRDAQGNTLGVYDKESSNPVYWREQQLYGSSRLGMWKPNFNLAIDSAGIKWNYSGLKFFELSNHLGNVPAVINDEAPVVSGVKEPNVMSAQDYYPFGMIQPGRSLSSEAYRYGFNGKENDNDVKGGVGSQQDYGMRIYDPRVGKFLSVDPLIAQFPWFTSYQYAGNSPIQYIDLDGEEPKRKTENYGESVLIGLVNTKSLTDAHLKQFKTSNNNWIGKSGNIQEGLAYITSLENDMIKGTKLTNVVFNSHGGVDPNTVPTRAAFLSDPNVSDSYVFSTDVEKFMSDPNSLKESKRNAISNLKGIFDKMEDGGNFVFSICNLGKDDNMGKVLQELSGGRINIYLTPDLVRISGVLKTGKWKDIEELNLPRIQDGLWTGKKEYKYDRGFILYPDKFGEPIELDKNIKLNSLGKTPLEKTVPTPKK